MLFNERDEERRARKRPTLFSPPAKTGEKPENTQTGKKEREREPVAVDEKEVRDNNNITLR